MDLKRDLHVPTDFTIGLKKSEIEPRTHQNASFDWSSGGDTALGLPRPCDVPGH
jgi:hypothetical protein